jgi:hypothetical protein
MLKLNRLNDEVLVKKYTQKIKKELPNLKKDFNYL